MREVHQSILADQHILLRCTPGQHIQDTTTQKRHNWTLQKHIRLFYFVAYQHIPVRCTTELISAYKKHKCPTKTTIQKAQNLVRRRSSTITNFKNIRHGLSMMTNLKQFWHSFMTTVSSAQSNLLEREKNKNKKRNYFSSSCFNLLRSTNVQSLLKQGKTRLKVCRGCQAFHSEASFSFSFIDHSFILARSMEGSVSKTLVGQNH